MAVSLAAGVLAAVAQLLPLLGPAVELAVNLAAGALMMLYLQLTYVESSAAAGYPVGAPDPR